MDFDTWEPVYEAICTEFGYGREGDERARDLLAELLAGESLYDPGRFQWREKTVAIAGGAPSLTTPGELAIARSADVVVAASIAADRLQDNDVGVDCMVTDLDKNPETARELTTRGVPVVVHAHGDNSSALREWVPQFDARFVIPTTQSRPTDRIRNFGGFTDGDRAAFLADAVGGSKLVFPGWEFDDPTVSSEKARKLRWAARLLYWLETRRGERFGVLDGRREKVETGPLPVNGE